MTFKKTIKLRGLKEAIDLEAKSQRNQLIKLAESVKTWKIRSEKAKSAGELKLASRANQHINKLMEEGRLLWEDLAKIDKSYKAAEQQISGFSQKTTDRNKIRSLEEDWKEFEIQEDLEQLKRKNTFKD